MSPGDLERLAADPTSPAADLAVVATLPTHGATDRLREVTFKREHYRAKHPTSPWSAQIEADLRTADAALHPAGSRALVAAVVAAQRNPALPTRTLEDLVVEHSQVQAWLNPAMPLLLLENPSAAYLPSASNALEAVVLLVRADVPPKTLGDAYAPFLAEVQGAMLPRLASWRKQRWLSKADSAALESLSFRTASSLDGMVMRIVLDGALPGPSSRLVKRLAALAQAATGSERPSGYDEDILHLERALTFDDAQRLADAVVTLLEPTPLPT